MKYATITAITIKIMDKDFVFKTYLPPEEINPLKFLETPTIPYPIHPLLKNQTIITGMYLIIYKPRIDLANSLSNWANLFCPWECPPL
jgi:hypothetical protein